MNQSDQFDINLKETDLTSSDQTGLNQREQLWKQSSQFTHK